MKISNRTIALLVSLLLIVALFYWFSNIVTYALIAWVVSMIGQPLFRFYSKNVRIGKYRAGENVAALLTLLTFFLAIGLLFMLFLPPLFRQVNNLAHVDYAALSRTLQQPLLNLQNWLVSYGIITQDVSLEQQLRQGLTKSFEPAFIKNYVSSVLTTAGNIGVTIGSVVFISFFFLKERGLFVNFLAALMPTQYDEKVKHAINDIAKNLSLYFRGLVLQLLAFALTVTIALWILGVKNALLIGFFAGLLNIVPYVGPIIGALFGVVFTISSNLDQDFYSYILPMVLKVLAVFFGAQLLDNNITQPLIFSNTLKTHPLEIFFVVLMGAQIGGVMGMVLAIPGYMVVRVVAAVFLSEFHIVQNLRERMSGRES